MANRSDRVCDQELCDRPARPRGPECRQCYKKLHKRERRAQGRFELSMLSLDDYGWQVSKRWYDEWLHDQD